MPRDDEPSTSRSDPRAVPGRRPASRGRSRAVRGWSSTGDRLVAVAALLAFGAGAACGPGGGSPSAGAGSDSLAAAVPDTVAVRTPIRAVTLDARDPPEPALLDRLQALGATHLALVSFGFQERADSPEIRMHTEGGWYSETDRGIRTLARQAGAREMGVILKPHVWVGAEGESRREIGYESEEGWRAWERNYRRFLMHYARLAAEVEADLLVVGTELRRVVAERPGYWRRLVRDVRAVYHGRLSYAANWYEEYREVPFWDALDYVGVQAYFPVADGEDPPPSRLRAFWAGHRASLERVHRRTGRPVLFTELGYRSASSAASEPWKWPQDDGWTWPDRELQARLYRAALATMMPEPWFAGALVWKWHPEGEGRRLTGFTPQGKPAEAVIRRWFLRAGRSDAAGEAASAGRPGPGTPEDGPSGSRPPEAGGDRARASRPPPARRDEERNPP